MFRDPNRPTPAPNRLTLPQQLTSAYVVSTYEPNMPEELHKLPTGVLHKFLCNNMLTLGEYIFGSLCSFFICSRRSAGHKLSNAPSMPLPHAFASLLLASVIVNILPKRNADALFINGDL